MRDPAQAADARLARRPRRGARVRAAIRAAQAKARRQFLHGGPRSEAARAHLERAGFVVMEKPPLGGAGRRSGEVLRVRQKSNQLDWFRRQADIENATADLALEGSGRRDRISATAQRMRRAIARLLSRETVEVTRGRRNSIPGPDALHRCDHKCGVVDPETSGNPALRIPSHMRTRWAKKIGSALWASARNLPT